MDNRFYNGFNVFDKLSSIFKNPDVLKEEHIPDKFLFREEECKKITDHISSFFQLGMKPSDMFIYGPPSTGKTHMIKKIVSETNEFAEKYDWKIKLFYTSFKNRTYREGLGNLINLKIGKSGFTANEIIEKINHRIRGYTAGFVFDEVDKIIVTNTYPNPIDMLIGTFTRFGELFNNPNVFIIVISNKDITRSLTPPSRSTFIPVHIYFRDYKLDEIYQILKHRCEQAFVNGAISDETLLHLLEKLGKVRDLRLGLRTLLMAGKLACMRKTNKITDDIIDMAFEEVQKNIIKDGIINADDTQLLIVYFTALLQKKKGKPQMTEIYRLYKKEAINPLSFGYISNYVVPKLEGQGLIMNEVKGFGRGKGKARFLWVEEDKVDDILQICREELKIRYGEDMKDIIKGEIVGGS